MKARALSLVLLLACACWVRRPRLSSDISTRDIVVALSISGASLRADVRGPAGGFAFDGGDRLFLIGADQREVPFVRTTAGYSAELAGLGGPYELVLERPMDESAIESITVPPAFSVTAPPVVSRGAGFTASWDGQTADTSVEISLAGACIKPVSAALTGDPGARAFVPAELIGITPGSCPVTIDVRRTWRASRQRSTLESFSATIARTSRVEVTCVP